MSRNTLHMSSNVQRVAIIQIKKNAERGKDRPEKERKRKGKSISLNYIASDTRRIVPACYGWLTLQQAKKRATSGSVIDSEVQITNT